MEEVCWLAVGLQFGKSVICISQVSCLLRQGILLHIVSLHPDVYINMGVDNHNAGGNLHELAYHLGGEAILLVTLATETRVKCQLVKLYGYSFQTCTCT